MPDRPLLWLAELASDAWVSLTGSENRFACARALAVAGGLLYLAANLRHAFLARGVCIAVMEWILVLDSRLLKSYHRAPWWCRVVGSAMALVGSATDVYRHAYRHHDPVGAAVAVCSDVIMAVGLYVLTLPPRIRRRRSALAAKSVAAVSLSG